MLAAWVWVIRRHRAQPPAEDQALTTAAREQSAHVAQTVKEQAGGVAQETAAQARDLLAELAASGAIALRLFSVVASALRLPLSTCGQTMFTGAKASMTRPATT